MKKLLIIFLSCMIVVPSFGSFFVYTSFKLNQQEIAKTICIQRKMVFNTCNGRCELQKSLKKYSDNEKGMQDSLKEKAELVYLQNNTIIEFNSIALIESKKDVFASLDNKPVSVSISTFRPPSYLA